MRLFGARRTRRRDDARRAKYKVVMIYPNGETDELDEVFDTEEEADEYGLDGINNYRTGMEVLRLSNPGDYGFEEKGDDDDVDYEILEVDA